MDEAESDNAPEKTEKAGELTKKLEDTIRDMIFHENGLVNSRMSWLLTLEGFLFAALGFAWEKDHTRCLAVLLSIVGTVVALSGWVMLYCSNRAIAKLRGKWLKRRKRETDYQGAGVVGFWAAKHSLLSLFQPPKVYPPLLVVAWFVVFLTHIGHCFWDFRKGETIDKSVLSLYDAKTEYRIAGERVIMLPLEEGGTLVIRGPKASVSTISVTTSHKDRRTSHSPVGESKRLPEGTP